MHTHRHFLRAAALALLALAGASALAEVPGGSQIYQQRGADGSIVLTDRPSPKAVTERTWQTQHDDAGAAQRALDVRREAEVVSERIQRRIEAQERRAADQDMMRTRVARVDRGDVADDGLDGDGYGYGFGVPIYRQFGRRHRGAGSFEQGGSHRQGPPGGQPSRPGSRPNFNQR